MSQSEIDAICEALGMTLEEARASHERVQARVEHVDAHQEVTTRRELDDGTVLHLHQLVTDTTTPWVITSLDGQGIRLGELRLDFENVTEGEVDIISTTVVTEGQFVLGRFTPRELTLSSGETLPMWGY